MINQYTHGLIVFTVLITNGIVHMVCTLAMVVHIQTQQSPSKSLLIAFFFMCYKTVVYAMINIFGINASYRELNIFTNELSMKS